MSISAIGGISSYDLYNSGYLNNMYQLMRYQYGINQASAYGSTSRISSFLGTQAATTASSSGVDKTQAFLSAYQSDVTSTEKAADSLNYFKPGNVFSQYTLGSSDEAVAEIENSDYKEIVFETTEEKMFFFIQAIQLSWIDNDYCEAERKEIRKLADELEISAESVKKEEKWVEEGMEWNKKGDELLKLS